MGKYLRRVDDDTFEIVGDIDTDLQSLTRRSRRSGGCQDCFESMLVWMGVAVAIVAVLLSAASTFFTWLWAFLERIFSWLWRELQWIADTIIMLVEYLLKKMDS
jgi:hypothetical protein